MSIRLMASPPIEVAPNIYLPKAEQYCTGAAHVYGTSANGIPVDWVLTFGRAADWVTADSDPDIIKIFQHPSNDWSLARQALKNTTLADLSAGERARLTTVFATLGVPADDFSGATPLFKIVRRLIGWALAKDDRLGDGIQF